MKVLHIINTYAPVGGLETYVIDLVPLLSARGVTSVVVYRKAHPRTPSGNGHAIYHVPASDDHEADHRRIIEIVRQEAPSVIYLHDVYDPVLMQKVMGLAPTIGYVHIFYPVCPGLGKLYHRGDEVCERPYGWGCIPQIYWRRCASAKHPLSVWHIVQKTGRYLEAYRQLPTVIVASRYMKGLMVQNGVAAERVAIIPYFIPIPSDAEIEDTEVRGGEPIILFAGRLAYEKGVPYLLAAVAELQMPYRLIIAGDGSLRTEYEALAQTLGIAARVEFMAWLTADELMATYRQATVTVMPTIMAEPFGKVGVEAMANGSPVVAFDVGGIPDWLKDGTGGYLVPPRNVGQLTARLEDLLQNPQKAYEMGQNGRSYVREHYSAGVHLDRLIAVLEEVARGA